MREQVIAWRDFDGRLHLEGGPDTIPENGLRRADAVDASKGHYLISRPGSTLIYATNANSMVRFSGHRFAGDAAGNFYRDNAVINTGLNGNRLYFAKMPPQTADANDYLFCSGGGSLFKSSPNGVVSMWGIFAPGNGLAAASTGAAHDTQENSFDASAGSFTGANCTPTNDTTLFQEGTGSLSMKNTSANTNFFMTAPFVKDFTTFGGGVNSTTADLIQLWVYASIPGNIKSWQFYFGLDANSNNLFSYTENASSGLSFVGTASSWVRLAIPKNSFIRRGGNSSLGWANVSTIVFSCLSNSGGGLQMNFDDLRLTTVNSLKGTYSYLTCFANSTTNTISNPNTTATTITLPSLSGVSLTNIQTAGDSQVDTRVLYRTVGNNATYFYLDKINDNTTTTYTDTVNDASLGNTTIYPTVIQFDNTPPAATYNVCAGPFLGCMFWCNDSANTQRLYYSPVGRPESVENSIDVTFHDDTLQRLLIWNGNLYAFSKKAIFAIQQASSSPLLFVYNKITGAPGTLYPSSVVAGKNYIAYETGEGIVLFDGTTINMAAIDSMRPIFRSLTVEAYTSFTAVVGEYARGEYIFSDAAGFTFALNENDFTWRSLGIACNALFYEDATDNLTGTFSSNEVILENPGTFTDNGTAIPYQVQTRTQLVSDDKQGLLKLLVIDIDSGGQTVTPSLVIDGTNQALPTLSASGRTRVEYTLALTAHTVAVRLTASLTTAQVILYGIFLTVGVGSD